MYITERRLQTIKATDMNFQSVFFLTYNKQKDKVMDFVSQMQKETPS